MTDRYRHRLSEYLDGELSAEEERLLEAHLRACEGCARTLGELEEVVARAGALPPREPPATVWEGIARRIEGAADEGAADEPEGADDPGRRRAGIIGRRIAFSVPQLAAAAVTLAALSAGVAWLAGEREPTGSAAGPAAGPAGPAAEVVTAAALPETLVMTEYYAGEIAALERALFDPARPLPPETEVRVRRALATIDAALEEARRALEESPENLYLREHVTDTMRRKGEFLRRAVKLAAQG